MIKDSVAAWINTQRDEVNRLFWASQAYDEANIEERQARNHQNWVAQDAAQAEKKSAETAIVEIATTLSRQDPTTASLLMEAGNFARSETPRSIWQSQVLAAPGASWQSIAGWNLAELMGIFENPTVKLNDLAPLSFWFSFRFTLAKPYISRDEEAFYVMDNPVRRDRVLRLPFVAATSYKGALRSALRHIVGDSHSSEDEEVDNPIVERLFGTDRRRETRALHQGRLCCFPSFFHEVGLEVINPHLRDTGAGDKPILFETATGNGLFHLLYVPFDLEPDAFDEVADDIEAVAQAVTAMFLTYGFGAKTSSGFGEVKEHVAQFDWTIHHWMAKAPQAPTLDALLDASIADFVRRFSLTEFPRWNNAELEKSGWGSSRASEYKRIRNRHPDWDQVAQRWREPVVATPRYELLQVKEASLDLNRLPDLARDLLAAVLRKEAER